MQKCEHKGLFKDLSKPATVQWLEGTVGAKKGGRYDSPNFSYRVTYAGSSRKDAAVEVLASLRSDPRVVEAVGKVDADERPFRFPLDALPRDELEEWCFIKVSISGEYVEALNSRTMTWLSNMAPIRTALWRTSLAASGTPRPLTLGILTGDGWKHYLVCQTVSRVIFEELKDVDGIFFLSKSGADANCWAIFDRAKHKETGREPIDADDCDLADAMADLGLAILD